MKLCPACQRTYRDDTLSYCLEDGTALLSDAGPDSDKTLALNRSEGGREAQPTEVLDPALAPTLPSRKPSTPVRREAPPAGDEPQRLAPLTRKKRSTAQVAALTVVATVLLLGLSGLGVWLLLKDKKGGEASEVTNTERPRVSGSPNVFPPVGSNTDTSSGVVISTPLPTVTPLATPFATPLAFGYITGNMTYPSDAIPGVMVACAENVEKKETICSQKRKNWQAGVRYSLKVSPGRYYVYGTLLPGDESVEGMRGIKAYYTDYIKCGMGENCKSHKRITLEVEANETLAGITVGDWWANR
jgi:hypothetical protein